MTNTVQQEEQANPYNAKKDYHVEDKPFTPANQLYFEEPSEKNKLFDSNDITEVNSTANVNTEELETSRDTPYKKPDYKKRYDDLKKHYERRIYELENRSKVKHQALGKSFFYDKNIHSTNKLERSI